MRIGTDFNVLVSVDIGAVQVQIESQLQYDGGSWSNVKLLIHQYKQQYFWVLHNSNLPISAWSGTDIEHQSIGK